MVCRPAQRGEDRETASDVRAHACGFAILFPLPALRWERVRVRVLLPSAFPFSRRKTKTKATLTPGPSPTEAAGEGSREEPAGVERRGVRL